MAANTRPMVATRDEPVPLTQDDMSERASGLPVLSGWRLVLSITALWLGLFLSSLETTIIATALVTISSDFGHFDKSSWIVVSYFLTYTGLMVIFTRMSDIFGRKQALLVAVGFFTVWSLACGASQTMEELIVFRSLQGIGGSGIYSLAFVSILEITPVVYFSHVSAAVGAASACSSILGPILGGAITAHTTWRWVFWLNIPAGTIIIALLIFVFPNNIGHQKLSGAMFAQVDWLGAILSITASAILVFPLESGGSEYQWNSPAIIVSFVISGLSWVAFTLWQYYLTVQASKVKMLPIFPTRLVGHRVVAAALSSGFLTGFPFTVAIINLPQRFQIVNHLSPVDAGIRVLPMLLMTGISAAITGAICGKKNISFYLLALSNILQTGGTATLSMLPTTVDIPAWTYGLEVVLGAAFGMGLVCLIVIARVEVSQDDHAVTMGAITQIRVLGGIVGLAIAQAILISSLHTSLSPLLTETQLTSILSSTYNIASLPPQVAQATRAAYGDAMSAQMRIISGFAGASLLVGLFAWRKERIPIDEVAKGRSPGQLRATKEIRARNTGKDDKKGLSEARRNDATSGTAVRISGVAKRCERLSIPQPPLAQPATDEREMSNIES